MIPLVFLFFMPSAADIYILPKIALAAVLVAVAWWRANAAGSKSLTPPMLAVILSLMVAAVFSSDPAVNLAGRHSARYTGVLPLLVCVLAYLLPTKADRGRQMRVAGVLMALYAVSNLFWHPLGYEMKTTGRAVGSIGAPPLLGCALAMCLPFAFGRPLAVAIILAGLGAAGSRGPMIAAVVAAGVWLHLEGRLKRVHSVALPAGAAALVWLFWRAGTSDAIRLATWRGSLQLGLSSPWVGVGSESYLNAWRVLRDQEWIKMIGNVATVQDHAHNDWLQAFAGAGLLGVAAYLWLHVRGWKALVARGPLTHRSRVAAAIAALLVCGKFNAMPFPCLFVAALLLGSTEAPTRPNEAPLPFLRGAAAALAVIFCTQLAADLVYVRGRRTLDTGRVMLASRINPDEVAYQIGQAELAFWHFENTANPVYLRAAIPEIRAAVARHPGSVQARQALLLLLVVLSHYDEAARLESLQLAPTMQTSDPALTYRYRRM